MKQNRVTIKQAKTLKQLGFNTPVTRHLYKDNNFNEEFEGSSCWNWNEARGVEYTSIPTVDEAIDWIRRKYNIVIYNKFAPFVDPSGAKHIWYGYSVKRCNIQHGWNFREQLGDSRCCKNNYTAKREAITIALKYITKNKAKVIKCRATATGRSKSKTQNRGK